MFIMQNNISHNYPSIYRYTTLRNAVACKVLIAPDGACHAFGMPAWLMMTSFPGPDQKQIIMFLKPNFLQHRYLWESHADMRCGHDMKGGHLVWLM